MKKVIVIFGVLAFTAGMALGQGYPVDYPDGYPNEAGVNTAIVEQNGHRNDATIDQIEGTTNYAKILQNISDSEVTIWQQGNTNFASSHQQGGAGNAIGYIYQIGNENVVDNQYQGAWGSADVYSYARQEGNRNFASQNHHENKDASMIVRQFGDDNVATQYQRQGFSGTPGEVSSEINQTGYFNEANTEQRGLGGHSILVTQRGELGDGDNGENNFADLYQNGNGGHDAIILQEGDNNRVEGLDGIGAYQQLGDEFNYLNIHQQGNGNEAWGYQNAGASATVEQFGNANSVIINQTIY